MCGSLTKSRSVKKRQRQQLKERFKPVSDSRRVRRIKIQKNPSIQAQKIGNLFALLYVNYTYKNIFYIKELYKNLVALVFYVKIKHILTNIYDQP